MNPSRSTNPDFSRPLEALKACHERIRAECGTLRKLVEHLKDHGYDEQARQAAASLMRYFDTAARHHHADEEEDLLPRMMAVATTRPGSRLNRMVDDITAEHREIDRVWIELRRALQGISAGENTPLDALEVDRFAKLYGTHITLEESNVYPLAEMLLSREDFAEIGTGMAHRRGGTRR